MPRLGWIILIAVAVIVFTVVIYISVSGPKAKPMYGGMIWAPIGGKRKRKKVDAEMLDLCIYCKKHGCKPACSGYCGCP